jgi:hypothetical protein
MGAPKGAPPVTEQTVTGTDQSDVLGTSPNTPATPAEQAKQVSKADLLADLAARIKAEHEAFCDSARKTLDHAIRAGEFLNKAKKAVDYGGWADWLRQNCAVSQRSAQAYMRLADHKGSLRTSPRCAATWTIDGALRAIGVPQSQLAANVAEKPATTTIAAEVTQGAVQVVVPYYTKDVTEQPEPFELKKGGDWHIKPCQPTPAGTRAVPGPDGAVQADIEDAIIDAAEAPTPAQDVAQELKGVVSRLEPSRDSDKHVAEIKYVIGQRLPKVDDAGKQKIAKYFISQIVEHAGDRGAMLGYLNDQIARQVPLVEAWERKAEAARAKQGGSA